MSLSNTITVYEIEWKMLTSFLELINLRSKLAYALATLDSGFVRGRAELAGALARIDDVIEVAIEADAERKVNSSLNARRRVMVATAYNMMRELLGCAGMKELVGRHLVEDKKKEEDLDAAQQHPGVVREEEEEAQES